MPPKQGKLRVRKGTRLYGPMTRPDLEKLVSSGRIDGGDQVSADDGPWMAVADFLAPPVIAPPPAAKPPAPARPAAAPPQLAEEEIRLEFDPAPPEGVPQTRSPIPVAENDDVDDLDILDDPSAVESARTAMQPPMQQAMQPPAQAVGEWAAQVRGAISTQLTKENLISLVMIGELHPGSPVHHATWQEHQWAPIAAIPELADVVRAASGGGQPPPGGPWR
ncbi:MAG: hypothetical protein AB7O62_18690 [Pirellulales bacterium]